MIDLDSAEHQPPRIGEVCAFSHPPSILFGAEPNTAAKWSIDDGAMGFYDLVHETVAGPAEFDTSRCERGGHDGPDVSAGATEWRCINDPGICRYPHL